MEPDIQTNEVNNEIQDTSDGTAYCFAVFHLKEKVNGSDERIDRYAKLICVNDNIIKIASKKFAVNKDYIDFISISFVTNSNAHLGFCGQVKDVFRDHNSAVYTIEVPKQKELVLNDGTKIDVPNESLMKYKNIHKSKRPKSNKKKGRQAV